MYVCEQHTSLNRKGCIYNETNEGRKGLNLPSTTIKEIYMVAYYKDDLQDAFNDEGSTLISGHEGSGGYPHVF